MDRKKTQKQNKSFFKRLSQESFFLSCTAFLSKKLVGLFETGALSFFVKSCKKTDSFLHDRIYTRLDKKTGFHDKVNNKLRRRVSVFFDRFPLFVLLRRIVEELLNISMRTVGAFLSATGISAAAMFFLHRFVLISDTKADPDNLILSFLVLAAGAVLMLFGSKNIVDAFCGSRAVGFLFSRCFGINEAVLRRERQSKNHLGSMFFFGLCFGAFSLIAPMSLLLKILFLVPLILLTMNIPEFGLLISVALLPVASPKLLAGTVLLSLVSYLLKYIRMKRNIHFGTAGACVLLALGVMLTAGAFAETKGVFYSYAAIFLCLYFLAKNLICSEALIQQTTNCLSFSAVLGMSFYIISYFCQYIPSESLYGAVQSLVSTLLPTQFFGVFAACMLPFAFVSFSSSGSKGMAFAQIMLSGACTVLADNFAMYITVAVSVLLYAAIGCKAPAGALLSAVILIPPLVVFASEFAVASAGDGALTGLVSGSDIVAEAGNFLTGMLNHGGAVLWVVFVLLTVLSVQRVFGCIALAKEPSAARRSGALAVCGTVLLSGGLGLNLYCDMRMYALVWFVLGFAGSLFSVYVQNEKEEKWGGYVL